MNLEQIIVRVDKDVPDARVIYRASQLIRAGSVLVLPTDTCYIFAANALDAKAVGRVFAIKKRPTSQPIHVAVANLAMAAQCVELNEAANLLATKFLPGPLTLILSKRNGVPDILVGGGGTLGIRIPDNRVLLEVVREAATPVTATSANIHGLPTPYTVEKVIEQLGTHVKHVALILDEGPLPGLGTSTIIDLCSARPHILREGQIPGNVLLRALGMEK